MGKRILLLGAGGHSKVVLDTIHALEENGVIEAYEVIDFLDDASSKAVGKIEALEAIGKKYDEVFCCIGNNKMRGQLLEKVKNMGLSIPSFIHPTAYVSPSAVIKNGMIVEPKAIVNADAVIEVGCIISVGAIVDHDAHVNSYCHVNAGAICKAGSVIEAYRKLEAGEVVKGY